MDLRRRSCLVATSIAIAMLSLSLAGCSGSGYSAGTGATGGSSAGGTGNVTPSGGLNIVEKNYQFVPSTLTVKVGDIVTFSNQDSVVHHVVVGSTDLGEQQTDQDVTWTADTNGTFPVKCTIHPSMTGQIIVGAGGASTPPAGGAGTTGGGSSAPPAGGSGGYGY